VLTINSLKVNAYREADIQFVQTFANQAAIAIENARLYTEAQESKKIAEAANRAKSAFLANMSHELRTPLNAILGFTQLMQGEGGLTAEQKEYLNIISRSGEHLLSLINSVLEMSKIEAGRTTLNEQNFDLYFMLDNLNNMFQLQAKEKGLRLEFDCAPAVPQYIRADEGKLRQVLLNLLSNALKFTPEGRVSLRVGYHNADTSLSHGSGTPETKTQDLRLFIEVEDTGPGMAPDELKTLFDPFVQTESGRKAQSGTGLGLAISQQFVELMGGQITVASQVGLGSLFKVDLPIALAQVDDIERQKPGRQVIGLAPDQPVYRLLVVEDELESRILLVKLLKSLGFEVAAARDGLEALEKWRSWEPHLVWMDIRMPVLNGLEATKQIKASASGQATVVIALTASAFEEDRTAIQAAGGDDFVRKPFQAGVILEKMALHLGVRYVYDDDQPALDGLTKPETGDHKEVLTPTALATLPADLVTNLQQATIQGEFDRLLTLIDQVHEQDAALAEALSGLANAFAFDQILNLIQQASEKP
jgi:signal transduction histidine kinase/CheY-like chemotaxis protein